MITNPTTYRGPLQLFTFSEQNGKLSVKVTAHTDPLTPTFFQVHLPEISPSAKELTQLEALNQMLQRGCYPLVSHGSFTFRQGLLGGMKRAASSADPYIPRDWSKLVKESHTFTGHTGSVSSLIALKDGTLASGSRDKTIKRWNQSGRCLQTFKDDYCIGDTLIELKDGTLASSGSILGTINLWDREGTCQMTLEGHKGSVKTLMELKDGTLASGGGDRTIKLWDPKSGKCLQTFKGHKGWVLTLVELSNGTLASGSDDNTIKLWDRTINRRGRSRGCIKTFKNKYNPVRTLIELRDGTLASGSFFNIKLWDPKSGKCLMEFGQHEGEISTLIELKDGTLASGCGDVDSKSLDNTIKLWDPKRGKCLQTFEGHKDGLNILIELKDGGLASGSWDRTIKVWKPAPLASGVGSQKSTSTRVPPAEPLGTAARAATTTALRTDLYMPHDVSGLVSEPPTFTGQRDSASRLSERKDSSSRQEAAITAAAAEAQFQKQLAELVGASEAAIAEIQARYEAQGTAFFEQMLRQQEAALQAALEESRSSLSAELSSELYQEALQKALGGASLSTLTEPQLQKLQSQLSQSIGPKLQLEIQTLMQSQGYQKQMQELQKTIMEEIAQRQSRLIQEVIHTQREQAGIKDRQSELYKAHETKKRRIQEQQRLQNPPSVCAFYNATEKHLSAKLMSAMMLVSRLIVRAETKHEKRMQMGGKVIETLCESIPIVGGVAGSLVSLGLEVGVRVAAERSEVAKHGNVFDSALRFKDAMALAELAARRTAQGFRKHIETLTPQQAAQAGEKAAEAMYTYLAEGHLKALAQRPMEEKIAALVKAVEDASKREKGFLSKRGGIFDKPVGLSPAASHQVTAVRKDVDGLGEKVDLIAAHNKVKFTLIRSIATGKDRSKAVASLRAKATFTVQTFQITRSRKELTISFRDQETLKQIASHLTSIFHRDVVDDCVIEEGVLIVVARSSIWATDLEFVLKEWLPLRQKEEQL